MKQVKPQLKKLSTKESDIESAILEYLALAGVYASKTDASRTFNPKGQVRRSKVRVGHPDISSVLTVYCATIAVGLSFFIEVKSPTGIVSKIQRERLLDLSKRGAICLVARDVLSVKEIVDLFHNKELKQEAVDLVNQRLAAELLHIIKTPKNNIKNN